MGGLLDKAKSASKPEEKPAEKKPVEEKTQPATLLSKSKSTKSNSANVVVTSQDGPDIPMILNIVGWVVIFIGALLSLQGGSWGLIVVIVVLIIGIGALVQSQRMSQKVSTPKMVM